MEGVEIGMEQMINCIFLLGPQTPGFMGILLRVWVVALPCRRPYSLYAALRSYVDEFSPYSFPMHLFSPPVSSSPHIAPTTTPPFLGNPDCQASANSLPQGFCHSAPSNTLTFGTMRDKVTVFSFAECFPKGAKRFRGQGLLPYPLRD